MSSAQSSASRYRWWILFIGVLAQMAFSVGFTGIPVAGVIMRGDYHFTLNQLGFVLGCMGLGVAFSEIIWGVLTDKLGDKIVLMIGLAAMGAAYLIISFGFVPKDGVLPSYGALGTLLIIAGAVGGSINSSSGSAIMTWFQDSERGFAMSIRQTAIPIGGAIGSIIVPWLASSYGFGRAFFTLAMICFVITLIVLFWLKELKVEKSSAGQNVAEGVSPLKRMATWKIAIAAATLTFPQIAFLSFAAIYLTDQHQMSMGAISIVAFIVQVGGGALRIITGRLTDKYKNRRQVIRLTGIIAGIAALLLALLTKQSTALVVPLLAIMGLAGNAWHGLGYTEIAVEAGVKYAGRALGMIGFTVFAVSFLIPYFIPFILKATSWYGVWIVVGVVALLSFPLMSKSGGKKAKITTKEGESLG